MRKIKSSARLLLLVVIIAALVLGGIALVKRKKQELNQASKYGSRPTPVTVSKSREGTFQEERSYLAVVEPKRTADISARVTATVTSVDVDEGDYVDTGDILVKLDGEEVRHRIDSVSAQIKQAKADLAGNKETIAALTSSLAYFKAEAQRYRRLSKDNAVPESQAEKAEEKQAEVSGKLNAARKKSESIQHRITSLEKQIEELQTRLGYYRLRAPFSGVISERMIDEGHLAAPGGKLVKVEDRSSLKLAFDIPQQDMALVKAGMPVRFKKSSGQGGGTAEITLIHPSFKSSRMARAEVVIDSKRLSPSISSGAYVPVSVIISTKENVTLVPRDSLIKSPRDGQYVFTVADNRLSPRRVNVLGFTGDQAAVTGVPPGMRLVRNTFLGWARLSSGEKVEAVQ
mgnify:CR=1 FL=1